MKVLVVDDDLISVELLSHALNESGHEVVVCNNGKEAIEYLITDTTCRMVITDWEMPEMNGIELTRKIRSSLPGRYVYVIILTGREGIQNVVDGLSAGADDFISKPFHPSELEVRLRSGKRLLSLETRNMTIFALAKLAESRDPETGAHLERVRNYSRVLAHHLGKSGAFDGGIDDKFVELLYLTTPLHDIGKVAIPDHILLKPGRLDEDEYEVMKSHTTEGAATLDFALGMQPDAEFLIIARDIAGCHHERFDGKGYPSGIAGDDIPLCARIFSVADVYDALISKRVYKEAFTHDVAKKLIVDGRGSQFDPRVVDGFLELEDQFREIVAGYRE